LTVSAERPISNDMTKPDPRLHPYRTDLAAEQLRDMVAADRYVPGTSKTVAAGSVSLRRTPQDDAAQDTELLFGETVTVYEDKDGWSWLQAAIDGYVGYAPTEALQDKLGAATHHVAVLRSYLFSKPDLKIPPIALLSMNSAVHVIDQDGGYSAVEGGGWLYTRHLAAIDDFDTDHTKVAQRFLGAPYYWGGKTSVGLDCSGLIQVALARCGQAVPRDSDMQENAIGVALPFDGDLSVLQSGDLVYWPGHAGIWIDSNRFIHANATDMMVSIAPLEHVAAYIKEATDDDIRSVRRLIPRNVVS